MVMQPKASPARLPPALDWADGSASTGVTPGDADLRGVLIDPEEDRAAKAVIWRLLREMDRR